MKLLLTANDTLADLFLKKIKFTDFRKVNKILNKPKYAK